MVDDSEIFDSFAIFDRSRAPFPAVIDRELHIALHVHVMCALRVVERATAKVHISRWRSPAPALLVAQESKTGEKKI